MEIKNFNIYSSGANENSANKDLKKKKLHKKTISCLNNMPHKESVIKHQPKELKEKKPLKHKKTKSQ